MVVTRIPPVAVRPPVQTGVSTVVRGKTTDIATDGIGNAVGGAVDATKVAHPKFDPLEAAAKITNLPFHPALFLGVPVADMVGNKIKNVADKRKMGAVSQVGEYMREPMRWYSELSFGNISKKLGIGGKFSKAAQPVFDRLGSAAEKIGSATGFSTRGYEKHFGKAAAAHERTRRVAGGINLSDIEAVTETYKIIDAKGIERTINLKDHMNEMRSAVLESQHAAHFDVKGFNAARTALHEGLEKQTKLSKHTRSVVKQMKNLGEAAEDVSHHQARANGWKNIKNTFHEAPKGISKAKVGHTVISGAIVSASAVSALANTRTLKQNLASLKALYMDMTGSKEDVSTFRLLVGNVPPVVAEARRHLIAGYGAKQVLEAVNVGLNFKRMGIHLLMPAFMGTMMLSRQVDTLCDVSILPMYKEFSDAHKKHEKLPVEAYATFLSLASHDLKQRGGTESPFTQELAQQYYNENASPAQILKDIDTGKLMARVHQLIEAHEAKHHPAASNVSHTQRLENGHTADRKIVGQHTEQLHKQSVQHNLGASPAV